MHFSCSPPPRYLSVTHFDAHETASKISHQDDLLDKWLGWQWSWFVSATHACHDNKRESLKCHQPRNSRVETQYSFVSQSNFYSANIPGKARLSGATAKSVFNSKIEETVPWKIMAGHARSSFLPSACHFSTFHIFICCKLSISTPHNKKAQAPWMC